MTGEKYNEINNYADLTLIPMLLNNESGIFARCRLENVQNQNNLLLLPAILTSSDLPRQKWTAR